MPLPELYAKWSLTSTGASTQVEESYGLRSCRNLTFIAQADGSGSTAEIGFEAGLSADGSTQGNAIKFTRMGSTGYSLSSLAPAVIQLTGPLIAVRPYVISKTASTTIVNIVLTGV